MSRYCAVKSCKSSNKDSYMHAFTRREPAFQQWLAAVNRPDLYAKPKKTVCSSMYVCDLHFAPSCKFPRTGHTNLKVGSVPTLYLDSAPELVPGQQNVTSSSLTDNRANNNSNVSLNINCPVSDAICAYDPFKLRTRRLREQEEDPLRLSPEPPIANKKPLDSRCRICLTTTDDAIPLTHSTNINEDSRTLCEILNKCSKVKIAIDDNKPQSLCIDCVEKARIAYEFSVRCESSELVLQKESENAKVQSSNDVISIIDVNEFVKTDGKRKPTTSPKKNEPSNPSKKVIVTYGTKKCGKSVNVDTSTVISKECVCMQKLNDKTKSTIKTVKKTLCVQCCRHFSGQARFKLYTNVLIGRKRYHCLKCKARFASPRNLELHIVSHKEVLSYKHSKRFLR